METVIPESNDEVKMKVSTIMDAVREFRQAHSGDYDHCYKNIQGMIYNFTKSQNESDKTVKELKEQLDFLKNSRDQAYLERNRLVRLLASIFPSGIKKTAIEGWSEDWHNCVYIDLPTGQCSWHYHDSQQHMFADLPHYEKDWDGHSTPVKYDRVSECCLKIVPSFFEK